MSVGINKELVTEWAKDQAGELALKAAKTDDWLEPVVERGDPLKDYDAFEQHHRERWEETIHWSILYGLKIKDLTDMQQDKDGFEAWWEAYAALKNVFWNTWEETIKLRDYWDAERGKFT